MELFALAVKDVEKFPATVAAKIIANQLISAVGSISANIAEEFGRKSRKEFSYHLGVAKGEATESRDWYIKCREVSFLDKSIVRDQIALLNEIIKMLNVLISKVKNF
ncbi:MAG: four helix bundle protein [bacterium]|nr:four helix bundle protein [bacterium]